MSRSLPHGRRAPHPFLAATAAIAVLAVTAVAIIALATRTDARASPAGAGAPAARAPLPPTAPDPGPAAPNVPMTPAESLKAQLAAATARLAPPPPTAAAPASSSARPQRPAPDLARVMPSRARYLVSSAIERQVPRVARCFKDVAPGFARRTAVDRRSFVSGRGVLRLELEPQVGKLLVLDASIELAGAASDAELVCAQRALRHAVLELEGVTPGPRLAMVYPIP